VSRLGEIYSSLYNFVCGKHPKLYPWHFQWLAVKYLYNDLKRVLPDFHGNVLDVGCGDKPYNIWLAKDAQHIGIDVYDGKAVDHVIRHNESWPIADASMDVVICTQVLEHVQDINIVLAEIDRTLKPGGLQLISVPFIYQEHGAPSDFRRFSYYGLLSMVSEKYDIIEEKKQGGIGSTLGLLLLSWIEGETNAGFLLRLLKGLLLPIWILFSGMINFSGWILDLIDFTGFYYNNVYILARKK